jgi:hypothetical protein
MLRVLIAARLSLNVCCCEIHFGYPISVWCPDDIPFDSILFSEITPSSAHSSFVQVTAKAPPYMTLAPWSFGKRFGEAENARKESR